MWPVFPAICFCFTPQRYTAHWNGRLEGLAVTWALPSSQYIISQFTTSSHNIRSHPILEKNFGNPGGVGRITCKFYSLLRTQNAFYHILPKKTWAKWTRGIRHDSCGSHFHWKTEGIRGRLAQTHAGFHARIEALSENENLYFQVSQPSCGEWHSMPHHAAAVTILSKKKTAQKIANVPSAKQRVLSPCLFSGAPGWAEYFKETLILVSFPDLRVEFT